MTLSINLETPDQDQKIVRQTQDLIQIRNDL